MKTNYFSISLNNAKLFIVEISRIVNHAFTKSQNVFCEHVQKKTRKCFKNKQKTKIYFI